MDLEDFQRSHARDRDSFRHLQNSLFVNVKLAEFVRSFQDSESEDWVFNNGGTGGYTVSQAVGKSRSDFMLSLFGIYGHPNTPISFVIFHRISQSH
jgi:hypothetical protein